MSTDSIVELKIAGLRTLANVSLRLSDLTILIGENGSGKSTIIEALEILNKAASPFFLDTFINVHGGLDALKSAGTSAVNLGVRIDGKDGPIEYSFQMEDLEGLSIERERLCIFDEAGRQIDVIDREGRSAKILDAETGLPFSLRPVPGAKLALTGFGLRIPHPAISRTIKVLERIQVIFPFAVIPRWVERTVGREGSSMRVSRRTNGGDALSRSGTSLPSIYEYLKEGPRKHTWESTMDYIRLGLGDDIEDVSTRQSNDGHEIWFKYRGFDDQVPARSLSAGTLGYLAFVALLRLSPESSVIAFDEPENHLHPNMVAKVANLFEALASKQRPILVATHSDRLLDSLRDAASVVVLCSLNEKRETELKRANPDVLTRWLSNYSGFGEIRNAGHEASIMTLDEHPPQKTP